MSKSNRFSIHRNCIKAMAGRAKGARYSIVFVLIVELELKFCDWVETDLVKYLKIFIWLRETHELIECIYVLG